MGDNVILEALLMGSVGTILRPALIVAAHPMLDAEIALVKWALVCSKA